MEKQCASELYFLRKNDKFVDLHLFDYILCHIYSKEVLKQIAQKWETLPPYIQSEVPAEICQKAFSGHLRDFESFLSEYWLNRAYQVLSAYQNAVVPYSSDLRADVRVRNLLSLKGFEEYQWIKRALWEGRSGHKTTFRAMKSANKFLLNIDLFKDFNLLKATTFYSRPQFGRIILSLSSGCYNMCSHCGFEAKPPVSHMPYPMFVRLVQLFGKNLRSPYTYTSQFYSDSDPISYRDDVIEADIGDICRYVKTELSQDNALYSTFVSKGVLLKGDDVALAKAFESNSVSLSFVDLPGEKNIARNKERIEHSLNALSQVPKERKGKNVVEFRHICLPGTGSKKADFNLDENILFRQINPVFNGRWLKLALKKNWLVNFGVKQAVFLLIPIR